MYIDLRVQYTLLLSELFHARKHTHTHGRTDGETKLKAAFRNSANKQCARAEFYCHLWPLWRYHILPHCLINDTIFGEKKVIEHKMCSSTAFCLMTASSMTAGKS
jgi:hypothetical protein